MNSMTVDLICYQSFVIHQFVPVPLSLYGKDKPDHFHIYDADKYSYLSNEAYYLTWLLSRHHFSDTDMNISGNLQYAAL